MLRYCLDHLDFYQENIPLHLSYEQHSQMSNVRLTSPEVKSCASPRKFTLRWTPENSLFQGSHGPGDIQTYHLKTYPWFQPELIDGEDEEGRVLSIDSAGLSYTGAVYGRTLRFIDYPVKTQ